MKKIDFDKTLKKNGIDQKDFAERAGYNYSAILEQRKKKTIRQSIYDSLFVQLLEKKGIRVEELIKEMLAYE